MVRTSSSNAGCVGSIPGRGAKIPHTVWPKKKKKKNIKQKQKEKRAAEDEMVR